MTPRDLIYKIIKAYQDARIPHYADEKIHRGRSHAISSVTEDLFAYYLISNDASIDEIYVDQPISTVVSKNPIYPDIAVVRNGTITAFTDLKMDLGYNRNGLNDLCKKHFELIGRLQGTECHLRDGKTKALRILRIADNASYNVIIVSRTNINPVLLDTQLQQVKSLSPKTDVFVLCDKGTPNSYNVIPELLIDQLGINDQEFQRLKEKLS